MTTTMSIVVTSMTAPMSARQCGCSEPDALPSQPNVPDLLAFP
jgi:hypothetical protein